MMEQQGNLPIGIAQEPVEEARHLPQKEAMSQIVQQTEQTKDITFAVAAKSSKMHNSHKSSVYKDVLSRPEVDLTQRQRLQWLQKQRAPGLWVQCDECNNWRFLPHVLDNHELPALWHCRMNPDVTVANCSVPESPIHVRDEEDLIHGEYTAGSVVWARLTGWPWWPAMVDDDPDTEQYYWLDGFSDIPTHYNVVFFDAADVTRAWMGPEQMKPYSKNKKAFEDILKNNKYKKRLQVAITQASDAENLPLYTRLSKYSFIAKYQGSINKPINITMHDVIKYQNKIKRKYNMENTYPEESAEESNKVYETEENGQYGLSVKQTNMIIHDTHKSPKKRTSRIDKKYKPTDNIKPIQVSKAGEVSSQDPNVEDNGNLIQGTVNEGATQIDSMAMEVASTVASSMTMESPNKGTSKTNGDPESVGEVESILLHTIAPDIQIRIASPCSDDFEF